MCNKKTVVVDAEEFGSLKGGDRDEKVGCREAARDCWIIEGGFRVWGGES